jgi:transposase InsO family protein
MEETISSSSVPVDCGCYLASIPRSSYYRHRARSPQQAKAVHAKLRQEIRRICREPSSGGYRRVTKELHRRGYRANHKRVLALMRQENLTYRRKRRWIHTTDSDHGCPVYPNLAQDLVLRGPDQLWVADITYVHLGREFVYLAVILDAFTRRVIGWALERYLDTRLTAGALSMALAQRCIPPGLVHHSDRGKQYASQEYVALLENHGIIISMSRSGNPYDNAKAESFIKTLKYEEVYINEYHSLLDARNNIRHFVEVVYNHKRLHSSLGYLPPAEFEAKYINTMPGNPLPLPHP